MDDAVKMKLTSMDVPEEERGELKPVWDKHFRRCSQKARSTSTSSSACWGNGLIRAKSASA